LDPLNIKALFFVCPGYVGLQGKEAAEFAIVNMKRVDVAHLTPDLYPVSWDDLLSLASTGHVIGAHGLSHRGLTETSNEDELEREILVSGEELGERLRRKISWFAYPYGSITSIDRRSLAIIGRGYRYCCSGMRGINTRKTHPLCLTRESIDLDRPIDQLKQIAVGGLDFLYYFKRRELSRMAEMGGHENAGPGN
jgi:peptidoglycan/xylan/chitin deacetylase (PgdA/CDA1 family)